MSHTCRRSADKALLQGEQIRPFFNCQQHIHLVAAQCCCRCTISICHWVPVPTGITVAASQSNEVAPLPSWPPSITLLIASDTQLHSILAALQLMTILHYAGSACTAHLCYTCWSRLVASEFFMASLPTVRLLL